MKIGLVIDSTLDSDAGVQQYFKGLARFLINRGHDIRFIVPPSPESEKGEFKGKILSFGFNLTFKGNANTVPVGFYFGSKKLKEVLRREKLDVVHIGAPYSPQLSGKVIRFANCPSVVSYLIYGKNQLLNKIYSKLLIFLKPSLSKVNYFIAISDAARQEAEKILNVKYDVIPIGVNLEKYSPDVKPLTKYKDDKLNILFLGRLEERKGVIHLLKAYRNLKQKMQNIRLIIAGDGPERKSLEQYVGKYNLKDVIFEGYIKEEDKAKYYASADLCVFPALYGESFGVVLLEAMASGKTTIAYANEGYRTVLGNIPELLIEPGEDLSQIISDFLLNDEKRRKFDRKCLDEAKKFSWETVGEQILDVYKKLV